MLHLVLLPVVVLVLILELLLVMPLLLVVVLDMVRRFVIPLELILHLVSTLFESGVLLVVLVMLPRRVLLRCAVSSVDLLPLLLLALVEGVSLLLHVIVRELSHLISAAHWDLVEVVRVLVGVLVVMLLVVDLLVVAT